MAILIYAATFSMVGLVGQVKEKIVCYILVYGCYRLFYSLEFLRFFKSVQFKFAEEIDGD